METVEIRCPVGPKRLLSKLRLAGEQPQITNDNLIEFSCDDCKRTIRKRGERAFRVLHRFNLLGDLVETAVER